MSGSRWYTRLCNELERDQESLVADLGIVRVDVACCADIVLTCIIVQECSRRGSDAHIQQSTYALGVVMCVVEPVVWLVNRTSQHSPIERSMPSAEYVTAHNDKDGASLIVGVLCLGVRKDLSQLNMDT